MDAPDSAVCRALAGWGDAPPEWVLDLARACDARSVRRVAADMGVSAALISRAINNRHHASLDFMRERVERWESATENVACPVLGNISATRCREERERPFSGVNPLRVQLGRTCPNCEHNIKSKRNTP